LSSLLGKVEPKPSSAVSKVSSVVQEIGFITFAPGNMTGLLPSIFGASVLYDMITPVSSGPCATFKCGFSFKF